VNDIKAVVKKSPSLKVAVGVVALLGVVACTSSLDMAKLKTSISDGVKAQMGLDIASVTCPEKRDIKAGDTFECTAVPAIGGSLTIKITQKDDQGNINWDLAKIDGLLDLAALETVIKNGLKEQSGVDATVSCGGKYRKTEPGTSFECTASLADGTKAQVAVTVKDAAGNVSYETVPAVPEK
jgi:hypothetical protein